MFNIPGPSLAISAETHAVKHRLEGESFRECMNRVASATKDSEEHFFAFREIIMAMRFLPAGRIQASMGSTRRITSLNCFVSGTISDNFTGEGGIMYQATKAAETMRMGGGIGYDFSTLRPRGELIQTLQTQASGPIPFMDIFDAVCRTIASAGHRRGAEMGVMRIDHPDIEEFIRIKQSNIKFPMLWEIVCSMEAGINKNNALKELQQTNPLTGFNISIGVTDEFMEAVKNKGQFQLRWGGKVYKTLEATTLYETIMRSTWDWGEPGILFLDTINKMNNLWYCENIAASNPCGEQPLPPNGACLLGSMNLVKYITMHKRAKVKYNFNEKQFKADIPHTVRALDNVIDRALYPLPEQKAEAKAKRRLGIGVTGLANAGEVLGYKYGSNDFIQFTTKILETLTNECYRASVELAKEKGPFPLFDKDKYMQGKFITRLPADIQKLIYKHGIRNSHLVSIAPAGTISLTADNVSSGIEPVFAHTYNRTIADFNGTHIEEIEDYGYRVFGVKGKTAHQCTIKDHLNVLLVASRYVDSAVSKTCNVDPALPWEDFKDIYMKAWLGGAKGCTTFNPNGLRSGILAVTNKEDSVCYIDKKTGKKECE